MALNPEHLSLPIYLTVQLQEILGCGDAHVLTYAPRTDLASRLQVSVHGGAQWYLLVQFPLPECVSPRKLDRLFRQTGWEQWQADARESRIYYLGRRKSLPELCQQAEEMARQIAAAMQILWNIHSVAEIALLGARGPHLALVQSSPKTERLALPRAA